MGGHRTWALVINAIRARILRDLEEPLAPSQIELVSKSKSLHLRDIMADKSGRSFASDRSGRRAALEPAHDPVLRDMHDFAQDTLDFLERHRRAQDFDRLAIFAGGRMLGILRQEMPPTLHQIVICEEPLNLVALSPHELRGRVRAMLQQRASE